ncbi:hypothetical protein OKA04_04680 [Luteolibacter flavescens]|uniref:DUF1320 domain-containing protein n=1 Tax=Luteolibacter flavescens TaxID=1859460 RepID=A0ABT3FKB5_9BACT|nr:hypothetical protein [Luteolibacter flavescens]MCW1884012.1 hypothetical protein [Luteolibacter flavescens]
MPEPWVTITEDEVLDSMTLVEREDFAQVSTAAGRPDRLPGIISDLIAEVRGYIATWSQNSLSADATKIPQGFRARALSIIRWRTLITIPGYDPGPARKDDWEKAEAFMKDVATGKIRPQPAPDAVPTEVPGEKPHATPRIYARGRQFTRRSQDGI